MKRKIALIVTILIFLTASIPSFAAGLVYSDVEGTEYETAVISLSEKGIISGYPDGTFRPEASITRAEASMILVKAMNFSQSDLNTSWSKTFGDIESDYWAKDTIYYLAEAGILSGYPDGTFKADNQVTYDEMIVMLLQAVGEKTVWPVDYTNQISKTLLQALTVSEDELNGSLPATRGEVALMVYSVVNQIKAPTISKPDNEDEDNSGNNSDTAEESAGKLEDYSGRAFGIVLEVDEALDEKGNQVQQIDFLFGNKILALKTSKSAIFTGNLDFTVGGIDCLKLSDGIIKDAELNTSNGFGSGNFKSYVSNWTEVKSIKNRVIALDNGESYTISDSASIYIATKDGSVVDGYKAGRVGNIQEGSKVKLYSVTKAAYPEGPIEVVIVQN